MSADAGEAGIRRYCEIMGRIKRRHVVLSALMEGDTNLLYVAPTIEAAYLQLRMMLELIAFASLSANVDLFRASHAKYAGYSDARYLLRDLKRINQGFYPQPLIANRPVVPLTPTHKADLIDADSATFLTDTHFTKLWEKCGKILHERNPFGSEIDYAAYEGDLLEWRGRIVALLEHHRVSLVGDPHLYIVQMGSAEQLPTYTIFAKDANVVVPPGRLGRA